MQLCPVIRESDNYEYRLKFDEAETIRLCLKGERKAQENLYQKFASTMTALVYRYVGNSDDAKDILQEGFVKVFRYLHTFQSKGSLEGWIRRIMVNVALDHCKAKLKITGQPMPDEDFDPADTELEILENMEKEHLLWLIGSMPAGFRLIFNLYALEGYSHKEIATHLGISESTSKTQYIRAKKRLLEAIKTYNLAEKRFLS